MSELKVGLVLSGGGAKGAYQVGVLKALLQLGTQIDAIAGTSIGAINAAIVASTPSLKEGIERLEMLWHTLAELEPVLPNFPAYLWLPLASGLKLNGIDKLERVIESAKARGLKLPPILDAKLLTENPLNHLMDQYFDPDAIATGIPLYVGVYKSQGALHDIFRFLTAELGIFDSRPSEFLHIQTLSKADQKGALLASAAIPLIFAPQEVNGTIYSDGGIGGRQRMQGNTPITPLLEAGINTVLVSHLSDGSLWNRHDYPNALVLEIRPQMPIQRDGGLKDVLGFDRHKIPSWIEQGYRDALHCVGRVSDASCALSGLRSSERALEDSGKQFGLLDERLNSAMARIR